MVDMKRDSSEKSEYEVESVSMEAEDYPYGLSFNLDKGSLKKLGKSASDFAIGTEMKMEIMVKVKGVSSSEYSDGDKNENVDLQITDIECNDKRIKDKDEAEVAARLYGDNI